MTNNTDVSEPVIRPHAYYYGFKLTKQREIDLILGSVACAGKAYHNTEDWNDDCYKIDSYLIGENPVEWIQNAANSAAEKLKSQAEHIASLEKEVERISLLALSLLDCDECNGKGSITTASDELDECPKCQGEGNNGSVGRSAARRLRQALKETHNDS